MSSLRCANCGVRPASEWRSVTADRWVHWAGCGAAAVMADGHPVVVDPPAPPAPPATPELIVPSTIVEPVVVVEPVPASRAAAALPLPPPPPLPAALVPATKGKFSFSAMVTEALTVAEAPETDRFAERAGRQTPRRVPVGVPRTERLNEPMEVDTRRRRPVELSGDNGRVRSSLGRGQGTSLFARDPEPEDADRLDVLDLVSGSTVHDGVEVER